MADCCFAHAGVKMLVMLYGSWKVIRLLRRRSNPRMIVQTLDDIPAELLPDILFALSCSSYKAGIVVCRYWRKALDYEVVWRRLCLQQWPGATRHLCTWREFAMLGGGDFLGKTLLEDLIATSNALMQCPAGHNLHQLSTSIAGFQCDVCLKDIPDDMTIWTCRECDFRRCMTCYNASQAPTAMLANGATNCCTQEGWTSLHYSSRLGFCDVSERLIDSRANVNNSDPIHGCTALMLGAAHGHVELCWLLLARGARKDAKNSCGQSALDFARSWGRTELEQLLQ